MGNCASGVKAQLHAAITGGDARGVVALLSAHPKYASKSSMPNHRTVWHVAAEAGQVGVLRAMADHVWASMPVPESDDGMHPTISKALGAFDMAGATALMLACHKGHALAVKFLLDVGADPWLKDPYVGRRALHYAATKNHTSCVHAVLNHPKSRKWGVTPQGKDIKLVDAPTHVGYTPLHYAVAKRSREAAIALFAHGCDLNAKTRAEGVDWLVVEPGSTPLHMCAAAAELDMAQLLLKYFHHHPNRDNMTDPRVVENNQGLRPYQLGGVRANKTLGRVLDPGTPLKDVVDPFGTAVAVLSPQQVQQQQQQQPQGRQKLQLQQQPSPSKRPPQQAWEVSQSTASSPPTPSYPPGPARPQQQQRQGPVAGVTSPASRPLGAPDGAVGQSLGAKGPSFRDRAPSVQVPEPGWDYPSPQSQSQAPYTPPALGFAPPSRSSRSWVAPDAFVASHQQPAAGSLLFPGGAGASPMQYSYSTPRGAGSQQPASPAGGGAAYGSPEGRSGNAPSVYGSPAASQAGSSSGAVSTPKPGLGAGSSPAPSASASASQGQAWGASGSPSYRGPAPVPASPSQRQPGGALNGSAQRGGSMLRSGGAADAGYGASSTQATRSSGSGLSATAGWPSVQEGPSMSAQPGHLAAAAATAPALGSSRRHNGSSRVDGAGLPTSAPHSTFGGADAYREPTGHARAISSPGDSSGGARPAPAAPTPRRYVEDAAMGAAAGGTKGRHSGRKQGGMPAAPVMAAQRRFTQDSADGDGSLAGRRDSFLNPAPIMSYPYIPTAVQRIQIGGGGSRR